MNSRITRVLIVVLGVAIGFAAAYLLKDLDTKINARRTAVETLRAREAALVRTIADVRAGQFAYVARGQGEAFWLSHVASLMPALERQAAEFTAALVTPAGQAEYEAAAAAIENFKTLDGRVREFVQNGNGLLAADLIFADGLESVTTASTRVTAALREDEASHQAVIAELRREQLTILGAASGACLLLMIVLALTVASPAKAAEPEVALTPIPDPVRFEAPLPKAKPAITPRLVRTAHLCGELARVAEPGQLPTLLERAAKVLDASGMIVWLADPSSQDLRPAMSHGYAGPLVARMGTIARDANNAAAAAYRAAEVRTVNGDPNTNGALIVPLMTSEGCVGVLSAEMKGGSEKDESSQALASIFAAQLATLVATPAAAPPMRAAAQG